MMPAGVPSDAARDAPSDRRDAPPSPGRFVTFEGGEGAGKSTQIRRLAARLAARGLEVVTTREPGGSPLAERLRALLLSGRAARFGPTGEAILFSAARADHVDRLIRPALAAGRWVLSDRFADSMRVYQGAAGQVADATVAELERLALDGLRPDLTILLDLPVAVGLGRATARRGNDVADRFERDDVAVHEARRQGFLAIARAEPDRVAVIDADAAPEVVAERVWAEVERRLPVPPGA
jgi:dTMP kinase